MVLLSWFVPSMVPSTREHKEDFLFGMGVHTEMRYDRASQYGRTKFIDPQFFLENLFRISAVNGRTQIF